MKVEIAFILQYKKDGVEEIIPFSTHNECAVFLYSMRDNFPNMSDVKIIEIEYKHFQTRDDCIQFVNINRIPDQPVEIVKDGDTFMVPLQKISSVDLEGFLNDAESNLNT